MRRKVLIHEYDTIISVENLLGAWKEFKNGKRNKGDVALFECNLMNNIFELHYELKEKRYNHSSYKAFKINDPKPRDIHKSLVRDRLLHHAIYRQLYWFFDTKFIFDSYSCRVNKGTHKAMNRFRDFGRVVSRNNTRTCWVLKCDIRKFFASIDHDILKHILIKDIADRDILSLLFIVIDSFSARQDLAVGLPLGNLTSQLLVNIYMNEFDQWVKHKLKARHYIRYADDFVFLHEDVNYLKNLMPKISEFLLTILKLSLHPDKVFIRTFSSGVDFLGWVHFPYHRVLRTSTKKRMLRKPKLLGGDREVIYSYTGLLAHGNGWNLSKQIESLIQH
jgi:retron-type reverse transcriptase